MKVAHLIASSGMYGAEKWILALMRAMKNSSIESILVNLSDSAGNTSAVVAGAHERELDACDFYTGGTFNPIAIYRFSRWLRQNNIDVVHGHGYKSDVIGLLAAKIAGCKIISTPHGWSKEADLKLQFYEKLDRFSFKFMDFVCPLSDDLMQSIKHCIRSDKRKLILNGVDIEEIDNQKASILSDDTTYRIGYIGQLIERKNLPALFKAFDILSNKYCDARLILVGDGPEKKRLVALSRELNIESKVDFLGYRSDALSLLKTFDVFVLPSLLEGIPRCVMEAMAAGVPVVVSDIPGNVDLVEDEVNGFLFDPCDFHDLCEKISLLMEVASQYSHFVESARTKILLKHSNDSMSTEYVKIYKKLWLEG